MIEPNSQLTDRETEILLEVYRQKYDLFRHFDSLRWQAPTVSLGAGTILLAFAQDPSGSPEWWSLCVFGLLCLFSSFAVMRIRIGIHQNHAVLHLVAEKLGDRSIPTPSRRFGATWWLSVLLCFLGLLSIGIALWRLWKSLHP